MKAVHQIHWIAPEKSKDRKIEREVEPIEPAQTAIVNDTSKIGEGLREADCMALLGRICLAKEEPRSCRRDREHNHRCPKRGCIAEPRNQSRIRQLSTHQRPHNVRRAGAEVNIAEES